ncbi:hypothetical protein SDC9_193654 [bioreactor metagenome]|uniref:Uncharacterized protein n=1 Tax=bioreactor metagenome TaxID=1076179 RepID=A0A645ICQ6_9ZZZZ
MLLCFSAGLGSRIHDNHDQFVINIIDRLGDSGGLVLADIGKGDGGQWDRHVLAGALDSDI